MSIQYSDHIQKEQMSLFFQHLEGTTISERNFSTCFSKSPAAVFFLQKIYTNISHNFQYLLKCNLCVDFAATEGTLAGADGGCSTTAEKKIIKTNLRVVHSTWQIDINLANCTMMLDDEELKIGNVMSTYNFNQRKYFRP